MDIKYRFLSGDTCSPKRCTSQNWLLGQDPYGSKPTINICLNAIIIIIIIIPILLLLLLIIIIIIIIIRRRQKCCAKGSGKEVKTQEFMYTTNVEPEMYDYTRNNWSHWNSNEKLKEKFGSCTGKTFDRFTTKECYTWNITHNTESTAVWSLKRERWGTELVQEKYQEEKAVTRDIHIV